jgi:hypothetical protein
LINEDAHSHLVKVNQLRVLFNKHARHYPSTHQSTNEHNQVKDMVDFRIIPEHTNIDYSVSASFTQHSNKVKVKVKDTPEHTNKVKVKVKHTPEHTSTVPSSCQESPRYRGYSCLEAE